MTTGIYSLTSPSGKRYIGSASNIEKRTKEHLWSLQRGDHHSRSLQRAWNKYGTLCPGIVLICRDEDLFLYEQLVLDGFRPEYNVSPSATGSRGLKWSEESKQRLLGRKVDGALISAGVFEKTTAEQRKKLAIAARSKWTDASKASQIAKLTGQKQSAETKAKRSISLRGHAVSPETKIKLAAQKGWTHCDEAKAKMRAAWAAKRS